MIDKRCCFFKPLERGSKRFTLLRRRRRHGSKMARDGGGDGLAPSYGSSFFRLCCLNWFVMKIRPSWKSVSETIDADEPRPEAGQRRADRALFEGGVGLGLGGLRAHGVALEVLGLYAITVDGALHSRRTRRPRVLLHELAVRGDRVVADGQDG